MRAILMLALMSLTYGAQAGDFHSIRPPALETYQGIVRPAFLLMKGAMMELFTRLGA